MLASITAGVDSRATLATALGSDALDRVAWFTYVRDGSRWTDRADRRISTELAEHYDLDHTLTALLELAPPPENFRNLIRANAFREPSPEIERALAAHPSHLPKIHIRSNLSEIGRAFYVRKRPVKKPRTGADLAGIYRISVKDADIDPQAWNDTVREFEHMHRVTRFGAASRLVDGRDLFYWEHRMGAWHAQSTLETDVAYDSVSLYNSRAVIAALLGPTLRARMEDRHIKGVIGSADPYLIEVPFNPGPAIYKKPLPPTRRERIGTAIAGARESVRRNRYVRGARRRVKRLVSRK